MKATRHNRGQTGVGVLLTFFLVVLLTVIIVQAGDCVNEEHYVSPTPKDCEEMPWYPDADQDGWGDATADPTMACYHPSGYTCNHADCNDRNSDVNPGTQEICDNGLDDDCNGVVDEITVLAPVYVDLDGDGYGSGADNSHLVDLCDFPGEYSLTRTDCDDSDPDVSPAAQEIPDGIDNDCDGAIDEGLYTSSLVGTTAAVGHALAVLGDQDASGLDEVLVAAVSTPGDKEPGVAAYLIPGETWSQVVDQSAAFAARATFYTTSGEATGTTTVSSLGDLDGDGLLDFAIGLPEGCVSDSTCGGSIYLFYGRGAGELRSGEVALETADAIVDGSVDGGQFGWSLTAVGDFDGDGVPDLAMGAPTDGDSASPAGAVYTKYGTGDRLSGHLTSHELGAAITGDQDGQFFGYSLTSTDLDRDGYDDLLIGAPGSSDGQDPVGAVYVVYGGATRLEGTVSVSDLGASYVGDVPGSQFGYALLAADVDGDGEPDVAMGAPEAKNATGGLGEVYLLVGAQARLTETVPITSVATILTPASPAAGAFGASLASGHLDDDLAEDLVLGAPASESAGDTVGTTYLVYGAELVLEDTVTVADQAIVFTGNVPVFASGSALATAELNGDGMRDILVGAAPNDDEDAGAVYLITD